MPVSAGARVTPEGTAWLAPARWVSSDWVELIGADPAALETKAASLMPALSALLESDWHRTKVGEELASRYEEIDLLYTITEVLGSTVRLDEAAQVIVREVAGVVGARRASIMVHDASTDQLRTVAARGFTADDEFFVQVSDPALRGGAGLPRAARGGARSGGVPGPTHQRAALPGAGVPQRADLLCVTGRSAPLHRRDQPD